MIRRLLLGIGFFPFLISSRAQALSITSGPTVVAVYISSATLTWTTDTPSDSILGVGVVNSSGVVPNNFYFDSIAYDPTLTQTHTLTVTRLTPGTHYGGAGMATMGQLSYPAAPSQFTTLALNASAPYDFEWNFTGSRHVAVGYHSYVGYNRLTLAGKDPNNATITYTLPPGLKLSFPQSWYVNGVTCNLGPSGSQTCKLSGSFSQGAGLGLILLSADATAVPGTYSVPFSVTVLTQTHSVNWTLQVDRAPQPLSRTPISTIPPIDPATLTLWQQTMTGIIAQDVCTKKQIIWDGYIPYTSGSNVYFYDGIRVFYQIAAYTGNNSWYTCADNVIAAYRDGYVIPDKGRIHYYWLFTQGLRMDYERTGDPKSLTAVELLGDNNPYLGTAASVLPRNMRETSFAGEAGMDAHTLGDPAMAVTPYGPGTTPYWQGNIDTLMGQLDQATDAHWGSVYIESFMVGLAMESLIKYYQLTNDPRIPPKVQKAADWLWANAWTPSASAFVYDVFHGPDPAMQNLNSLIAPAYAWLWAMTGDPKYLNEGDQMFHACVVLGHGEIGEGKQFSQSYRWSFDYVNWRTNPQSVFGGPFIALSSTTLNFSSNSGGAAPAAQTLVVSNGGPGTLTWQMTHKPAWLSLSTMSGVGTQGVTASVNNQIQTLGTYKDTLLITAAGAANSPLSVPVTLNVNANGTSVITTSGFPLQVYPNPWRSDKHANHPTITFSGLTSNTTIKIFSVSGHQAKELHTDGPNIPWDLTNDSGEKVASGIYVYLVADNQGDKERGKLAIIR